MEQLYRMPGHLIRRAQQISTAIFAEECAEFGITSVQFAALTAVRAHGEIDATRLSAVIAFDRSTIGNVLERLEAKGWLLRVPSALDRRVKVLRLTPDGEALLQRVEPAVHRVQQRLLQPLPPADRTLFLRLLQHLAEVHNDVTSAPLRSEARS